MSMYGKLQKAKRVECSVISQKNLKNSLDIGETKPNLFSSQRTSITDS